VAPLKFTVEIDSSVDIDLDTFVEIMNEEILTDPDFIMNIASSDGYYGNETIKLKILE
jgi:hypothetical protein